MSEYDFIVVGGGTAGCTVANRLTESADTRVLLLEAGGTDILPNVEAPALWYTLLGSQIDWGYQTVPQPGLDNRQTFEPRGKVVGGSSNLYFLMHIRGHASDFDNWAYNGCPGWSYRDVLPYLQKQEDQPDDASPIAGKGGPLPLLRTKLHDPNPTSAAFVEACQELGHPYTDDFNGPEMVGVGWHHINVKDGKRFSVREGYLLPILDRPNFTLSHDSHITRLLFSGKRCVGVEYLQNGEVKTARARGEVIVSCGAIESPKVLMLSGIGNPAHLQEFDIPVVADLPGVGENFHNHILVGITNECSQPIPPPNLNMSEVALFCKSDPGWPAPDIQIAFVQAAFDIIIGQSHPNCVSVIPGLVRPLSRGWIRLASGDPADKPLINPNYLGVEADMERFVQAFKLSREIVRTKAFSGWFKEELSPGADAGSDDDIRAFIRQKADSYHHQSGSCKMGLDDMAVVDPQLRVHGVEGLRVADASVMPAVPSGNCHAAVVMIAEKVSDLLKEEHGLAG